MSLLGVDVGTTGAKAVVFAVDGSILGSSYVEYDISRPAAGHAELDAATIWPKIRDAIGTAVALARESAATSGSNDPVQAIAVDSMGENLVPVSADRQILGPSVMNMDVRGEQFMSRLAAEVPAGELYSITGNAINNQFSIGKLVWLKENLSAFYDSVDFFLPWNSFVSFMLGADPVADYSLANRTLLFDLDQADWSDRLITIAGLDGSKLPRTAAAGTVIGQLSTSEAHRIGVPAGIPIVLGSHDQPSASLGSGAVTSGTAMYGMGTFHCIAPVFTGRKPVDRMMTMGLNTEHHSAPELLITLIYNSGGAAVKWFRDTFAPDEPGGYRQLFSEMPEGISPVQVVPHFTAMGPPDFIDQPNAAFTGMHLASTRGDILRGIVQANVFSLKMSVDGLPDVDITIDELRPTGGGSRSDAAVQIASDILGLPCTRPEVTEASALGCALLAGTGAGVFTHLDEAVNQMVRLGRSFEPNPVRHEAYADPYEQFLKLRDFVTHM